MISVRRALPLAFVYLALGAVDARAVTEEPINPPPTPKDWADLAHLPDWSGVWTVDVGDQVRQEEGNPPPWTPKIAKQIATMRAQEKAGHPRLIFSQCLPEAMPAWMLVSHNAMEILFTPGRVTFLGESDGNRLRRIYTDGRKHPDDPDPTFFGHSIGRWQGDTLVVDTVGILPQTFIAISEAVGSPNNGDMHIVERMHLAGPDTLHVDLQITAPHVLTKPWTTTRIWHRLRKQKYDIVEGVCEQGSVTPAVDKDGNSIFEPVAMDSEGVPVARP